MVRDPARVRFTREMLSLIADAGLLEGESYELLDGDIYEMPVESPYHTFIVLALERIFAAIGFVRREAALALGDDQLKPDLAIVERDIDEYRYRHPSAARFIIEVAASSRARDLGAKSAAYANAGVGTYWVIDLDYRVTIVHTAPNPNGYARTERVPFEKDLSFEGVTVNLADLVA